MLPGAKTPCRDCRNLRILMKRWKEFNAPALFPVSAVTMGAAAQPQQAVALLPPPPTAARPTQPASPTRAAVHRPAAVTTQQPASPPAAEAGPAHAPPGNNSSAAQQSGELGSAATLLTRCCTAVRCDLEHADRGPSMQGRVKARRCSYWGRRMRLQQLRRPSRSASAFRKHSESTASN